MQAIRYILAAPGAVSSVYPAVYRGSDLTIFENKNALPRAYVVDRIRTIKEPEQLLSALKDPSFDAHAVVLLEEDGPRLAPQTGTPQWSARILETDPEDLQIDVESDRPAMLILSDNDYPGWKATVNGMPRKIYRANYAFRSVEIPAGKSQVRFQYDPPELKRGSIISVSALVAWLSLAVWAFRMKSTHRDRAS
jgi:hypothetical protein